MKIILIDCRFAATGTGLGRYTREIVTALLRKDQSAHYKLLVRSADEPWIPDTVDPADILEVDIPHYSLAEQRLLPSLIKRSGATLYYATHFNVPFFCPIPFVATIHDLILHRYPNNASALKRAAYRIIVSRAVKKAESLVAVSSFTAEEIEEIFGRKARAKTTVVTEGVDDACRRSTDAEIRAVQKEKHLTLPYFLYVGNAKQHKNVQLLIDAFADTKRTDVELVLVSHGKEVSALRIPDHVRILDRVTDEELLALYSGALATVTASVYEGYCLPVAESLACGTPVLATNRTAIPETAQGHVTLLEPTLEAYTEAMSKTYEPIKPHRVGTWEHAAEHIAEVLH